MKIHNRLWLSLIFGLTAPYLLLSGCSSADPASTPQAVSTGIQAAAEPEIDENSRAAGPILALPDLEAADLSQEPLQVVTTTSIIGDVVSQVGGDAIKLTSLMAAGQDPQSHNMAAQDMTAVSQSDIIFVNGWDLEEALVDDLENIGEGTPVIAISAGITPLIFGAGKHAHQGEEGEPGPARSGADPHVWLNVHHVEQWAKNTARVLSELDPANAVAYEQNAAIYLAALQELDGYALSQFAQIPPDKRYLVTYHNVLGYLTDEYGFEVLGTIIPGMSTLAEPSARELAGLIEEMNAHNLCTIFTETTVSDTMVQTLSGELDNCDELKVQQLYTGAIGPDGSATDSYIGLFRANVDAIVEGLR